MSKGIRLKAPALTVWAGLLWCAPVAASGRQEKPFDVAALLGALRQAGATVKKAGGVSQPFFSVGGRLLLVDQEDVQVFQYRDEASAERDARSVSPTGSTIGTASPAWMGPPHFHRKGALIALYVGDTPSIKGVLQAALGPQFAGQ